MINFLLYYIVIITILLVGVSYFLFCKLKENKNHKQISEALRISERRLANAQRVAHIGSWDWNLETKSLYWSNELYRIYGYKIGTYIDWRRMTSIIHPDDKGYVDRKMNDIIQKSIPINFEYKIIYNNNKIRKIQIESGVEVNNNGDVIRIFGVAQDVTERRDAQIALEHYKDQLEEMIDERTEQLENVQEELVRKERLATIGQLTAVVGHELRNPLGTLKSSIYLIKKQFENQKIDKSLMNAINRADRNINRCNDIIGEMLTFTRVEALKLTEETVDKMVKEFISEINVPTNIKIENKIRSKLKLFVDKEKLRRVFINVINNATEAINDPETGKEMGKISLKATIDSEHLTITFSDNGPGIPTDKLQTIAEPLISTKGFGIGLGLPTVKQIMEHHCGGFSIDSVEGKWTSVKIQIPLTIKELRRKKRISKKNKKQ